MLCQVLTAAVFSVPVVPGMFCLQFYLLQEQFGSVGFVSDD